VICSYAAGVSLSSPAIGDDGTIYSKSTGGVLYAINPDCTLKWKYQASGVTGVLSPPVIADDGTIYFLTSDSLYAVTPGSTGATLKWQRSGIGVTDTNLMTTPAIGSDGTIYVFNDSTGILYAINPSDGSVQWQYQAASNGTAGYYSSPVIGCNNVIYIGASAGGLYAVNPDGRLKWRYTGLGGVITYATTVVGSDCTVYTGILEYSGVLTKNSLAAVNPDGSLKWSYQLPIDDGVPPLQSVSIGNDRTIYGITQKNLYAINPDGSLKWSFSSFVSTQNPSFVIGGNGTLYLQQSGINGGTYAINSDGTLKWWQKIPGQNTANVSPVMAPDGTIYVRGGVYGVLSSNPTLHAIQGDAPWTYTDYQNSMKGYADSPWPRFKQNNFNTGHRPKMPAGVSLPDVQSCNQTVSIPITLNNSAKVGIEGIDLTVTFDSSVIKPSATPATLSGGILQSGYGITPNTGVSGQIRLSIYATGTLSTASGVIAYLNFDVIGSAGSTTKLSFTQSLVNSVTSSRTDGSFTVIGCTISGKVVYHSPSATPIPNAQIILDGTPVAPPAGYTDANGNYTITASPGTHKVSVSKITDLGGVSGTDASDISRYAAGRTDVSFNCYQKIAADVNRDGQIDSVDASRVARYSVGLIPCMNSSIPCIDWVFTPYPITSCTNWPPITYPTERTVTIPPSATGQDFIGIRLGYVTGDWLPGMSTRSLRDNIELRENSATCNQTASGSTLKIPVVLSQSSAIKGIDIVAEFDSSVLTATDVTLTGGILDGKGYTVAFNTGIAGKISATIYAAGDVDLFTGSGEVGYISFTVSKSQSTAISLTKFNCNKTAAYGGLKIDGLVCQIPIPVVLPSCDPDFDGKFTMSDAIYYLQCIAGVRQDCICNENLGSVIQVLRIVSGL